MGSRRFGLLLISLGLLLVTAPGAGAQESSVAKGAPIPPALYMAKDVFISNAGADSGLFPHPFSGDSDRAYNQFYVDVQGMGRFKIVGNPEDADLVLELQLSAPNGPANANKQKGASDPLPMFRLVVWDRRTHYVLWALTESVEPANLQKTHDLNFDNAIAALARSLKKVATAAP